MHPKKTRYAASQQVVHARLRDDKWTQQRRAEAPFQAPRHLVENMAEQKTIKPHKAKNPK
jgi:hypothetical protein